MPVRPLTILCIALLTAALVAGCGGSSDSSTENTELTKTAFIEKANAICNRERGDLSKGFTTYLKQHQGQGSQEEVFASMMKVVLLPTIEADIKALSKLEAPSGDEAKIEEFLRLQKRGVEEMSRVKRLPEGPGGEKYLEPASRLAKAYGIKSCAQS